MSIYLWSTEIWGVKLGSWAINLAYLWETAVFGEAPVIPSNWLLTNLISYYKADTNGSFPDEHWSNDWTINGATYTASWKINWGYDFDWVNDYISFWTWDIGWGSYLTVSIWFNPDTLTWYDTLITDWTMSYRNFYIQASANDWTIKCQTWNWITSWDSWFLQYTLSTWSWQHIVYTRDWTAKKLYINWILEDSYTGWFSGGVTTNEKTIGLSSNTMDWKMDEVWFWNIALNQTKITALYNSWPWLSYDNFTT